MTTQNLLVELFVEELPPKALQKLGDAFAGVLAEQLKAQGLAATDAVVTPFASPRRLAVHLTAVATRAADKAVSQKLMPVSVGLDATGAPTPALLKRLAGLGADASAVPGLKRAMDGKAEALFIDSVQPGVDLAVGLQKALDEAIAKLPIPKVMAYQLESGCELPGWTSVDFVRPAHGLVALHGADVVPIKALGLASGRHTHGHRFEAAIDPVPLSHADTYAATLARDGAVIASFAERKAEIVRQLAAAAVQVGGGCQPIEDEALLDEVTALVERPNVLVCGFDQPFLDVPQECLILTMKANQKYFPLLDAQGKLTNRFLVVSNISPADASAVVGGNERVVRPRLADAKFFFEQDRKKTLASRVPGLAKVVYHNKLGSQGDRAERVRSIAHAVVNAWRLATVPYTVEAKDHFDVLDSKVQEAALLAKTDLLTDMVGEFPELQGIMGGYYARHEGLRDGVAIAIEDHYKPRFAGDELPRNHTGTVLALADKLETLVGMFGIGNLPTGDKDPYALRRHALGVIRLLLEKRLPL
ncbi:MAG: Glycine--tRNA ligase beta subunit, partial [Pseudomonadota bacterium]